MLYIFLKCLSRIHYSPHRVLERTAFQQPLHLYNESNHKKVTRHPIIFSKKQHTSPISHLPFPFHSLPFIFRSKNSTFTGDPEKQYYFEGFGDSEAFNIRKNAYGNGGMSR